MHRSLAQPLKHDLALAMTAARAGGFYAGSIFAPADLGAWYEAASLASMTQDSLGTTAAAVSSPVGLRLDKRRGLARGAELVSDGAFAASTDALPFVVRGTATLNASGVVLETTSISAPVGVTAACVDPLFASAGTYEVRIDVAAREVANIGQVLRVSTSTAQNSGVSTTQWFAATSVGVFSGVLRAQAGDTLTIASRDGVATVGDKWTIRSISAREIPGNHALQATAAARPLLQQDGSVYRVDYDATDDLHTTTFAASLGAACTVARSIPGVGAQILTAQTIGTSFTTNVDDCALIILNRALTAAETANVTPYLNRQAGV